jgi:DNA-binding transcriptional regulator GbsR (MarR family)
MNPFYKVRKDLIKNLGPEAAILFAHLENLQNSFFKDIEFYQQQHRMCADLGLSKHQISVATQKLIDAELIETIHFNGQKKQYRILTSKESLPLLEKPKTRKRKMKNKSSKKSKPLLQESSKESLPLAVKNLNREDEDSSLDVDLSAKDEKQKDPSQFVTHVREAEPETYLARWAKELNLE